MDFFFFSPDVNSQRNQLGERSRHRRRRGGGPAEGTGGADQEPLVNAGDMEAVAAVGDEAEGVGWAVVGEADGAGGVAGAGEEELGVGVDGEAVEAAGDDDDRHVGSREGGGGVGWQRFPVGPALDADADVGGEHDGGDKDENAHGYGDAVAEADAPRGLWERERGRNGI